LINGPRLLLADEPTGDLDATTAREDRRAARSPAPRQRISLVVVATHDEALARRAHTLYAMESGVLSPVSELAQGR
jgi:putative ABC transport system ATP-binding protein